MDFLPADLQQYVEEHTQSEPDLLAKINRQTHLQFLNPRMLSGHLQGRVLSMISHMLRPSRVLEIGTYTGYATLAMAEGLQDDGRIYTIDINEELYDRVSNFFIEAGKTDQIEFIIGKAQEVIPQLDQTWDLVFIDADKESYTSYYELIVPKMRSGGFIVADNVLWSGKVLDNDKDDLETESLKAFNDTVHNDPRVENVLLPIRDGLMILRKI